MTEQHRTASMVASQESSTYLDAWKLKSRLHATALLLAAAASIVYVIQQQLLWSASWRLFVILQAHGMLMALTHRLMFHDTRGVVWKSPVLTFVLRKWMVFFWPEGFEAIRAAHDTTQRSQLHDNQCLSESMLWFSPMYMKIDRKDFITPAYMLKQTLLQITLLAAAFFAWGHVSIEGRLWILLLFFVAPVVSRVLMYQGHSGLHSPRPSRLEDKFQNFTDRPYDRQAFNLGLKGSPFLSKYALGILGLGDHLHNNHHHDPNALCQAHSKQELDGAYYCIRLFHHLGLLKLDFRQQDQVGKISPA
jgi:hypothetical protein